VGNFVLGVIILFWRETCSDLWLRMMKHTDSSIRTPTTIINANEIADPIAMAVILLLGWFATVSISVLEFVVVTVEEFLTWVCVG
jgi:hypothetical protein